MNRTQNLLRWICAGLLISLSLTSRADEAPWDAARLKQERAANDSLEQRLLPQKGATLRYVTKKYSSRDLPLTGDSATRTPDDRVRRFQFNPIAILVVQFDKEWRVSHATFEHATVKIARVPGREPTLDEQISEVGHRAAMLDEIRRTYNQKFGTNITDDLRPPHEK